MSLTPPSINNCSLTATVNPSVVGNLLETLNINVPVFFNSVTELVTTSGSYTPSNNTLTIAGNISNHPNFIILITDAPVNLTLKAGGTTLVDQLPNMKLCFIPMPTNSTYNLDTIILDGTTSALVPMAQGTTINYTLIYGQATIA